jgi:hypothetical protein
LTFKKALNSFLLGLKLLAQQPAVHFWLAREGTSNFKAKLFLAIKSNLLL